MKKIYILASAAMFVSAVSAQKISVDQKPTTASETSAKSTEKINKKAPGDVFWYENFANGVGGNSVDGSGNPIGGAWTRGFTGATDYSTVWNFNQNPRGQYESNLPFLSESGANGWMIFDANYQTDQDNPGGFITIDGFLESPVIDITTFGTSSLELELQQTYRTCCSGAAYPVGIFVGYFDNGTAQWVWTKKNSGNASHNTYPASRTGSGYTAEVRKINIACEASLAAANTNEIKVRFHWNSELNGSNSYYMWMIDDVRIKEAGGFDANLYKMYSGDIINDFEYYAIPDAQIINYPLVVDGRISNQGGGDLTGVQLDVTVTNDATSSTVHSSSSPQQNITVCNGEGTIVYNTGFIPTDDAVYTVQLTASSNEVDEVPGNNTRSKKFAKTAFEFGHYNPNSPDVGIDVVNDGSNPGRVMSAYAIYEDATIYGFYIYLQNGTTAASTNTVGQIAQISIRDAADAVTVVRSQEITICSNCLNKVFPIRFDNPLQVFAGDFIYASLDAFGGGDILVVAADYDGDDDNSTLLDINGTLYGASQDPYVNLSFDSNIKTLLGTNEIKNNNGLSLMQNIPNPATFSTEIRYSLGNTANVKLEVVDVTGKVIATHALGMRAAGDHSFELNTSDFADGIYYYTLTAGADRLSNKMVIRK
jgi:hypothetical protein